MRDEGKAIIEWREYPAFTAARAAGDSSSTCGLIVPGIADLMQLAEAGERGLLIGFDVNWLPALSDEPDATPREGNLRMVAFSRGAFGWMREGCGPRESVKVARTSDLLIRVETRNRRVLEGRS